MVKRTIKVEFYDVHYSIFDEGLSNRELFEKIFGKNPYQFYVGDAHITHTYISRTANTMIQFSKSGSFSLTFDNEDQFVLFKLSRK